MSRSEKVSHILSSIHCASFSGVFGVDDVAQLQQALTAHSSTVSYYDLLNVPNDAQTVSAAKEKYHPLALRFHPDKTIGRSDRETRAEIFKLIQVAYETINNPQTKQAYDARLRHISNNAAANNREQERFKIIHTLQNNEKIRKKTLKNPKYLLAFAKKQKWEFVRLILLMFREMLDCNYKNHIKYFPEPGYRDNPFYTPGSDKVSAPFLTEFTEKFRDPIIFLLRESIKNPASNVFYLAFAVLKANPQWSAMEMLLHPNHRDILNQAIENLKGDSFRCNFQVLFKKATNIEQLLRVVDSAQRKKICEECVEHIRDVFLHEEHNYFRQMDSSLFPPFIIDNFSVVLAHKAVKAYHEEKQAAACCSSFFFSWKSSGSKNIFYALKEMTERLPSRCLFYGGMAFQLYHPGNSFFGGAIDASNHRHEVMENNKNTYELLFKTLADHGANIGTHLCAILQKYQLIDENKKPSQKLFSALRANENIERMNSL